MKKRHRIPEVVIKRSGAICSITRNDDGTISLTDSKGHSVEYEQLESVGYFRDSGKPKTLRSIIRDIDDQVGENPWKKYDKIGFIDTNSVRTDRSRLFICSPSLLMWRDSDRRYGDIHHVDLFVGFTDQKENPERIGWGDFIRRMQASGLLGGSDRFLLVVDSEKALITSINGRTEPVYENFFLPEGFTIAYATADSGAESWINREMKRRDRVASDAMKAIRANEGFLKVLKQNDCLYLSNSFEPACEPDNQDLA